MTTFDATNILPKGEPDLYSRELKVDDVMIFSYHFKTSSFELNICVWDSHVWRINPKQSF